MAERKRLSLSLSLSGKWGCLREGVSVSSSLSKDEMARRASLSLVKVAMAESKRLSLSRVGVAERRRLCVSPYLMKGEMAERKRFAS